MKSMKMVLATLAACAAFTTGLDSRASSEEGLTVGTFDSRALAVAWANSDEFNDELDRIRKERQRAMGNGDAARVAEIDRDVTAMQDLLHKQGFGVYQVDDILARIEDELPRIAKEAGVHVIVCKWDVVYRGPEAGLVDVSYEMAEPFAPDEQALRWIEETMEKTPIPLKELEDHGGH